MIGSTLSHYEITGRLGEGGMGEVYRARDLTLEREVALKVLPAEMAEDPERLARFKREARTLAAIDHPNIVTVYSVDEADGIHFVTMGLVEGKTLGELIPSTGLDLADFLELALPLAEALAAAHDQNITHRDLKPANVMVGDQDRRLRVLDFGLAKHQPAAGELDETLLQTRAMTREGVVMGTFPYMSPEQAEGRRVDHRTDIFSLGIILYEMITGSRPFRGDSHARLLSSILAETPPPVVEVKPDLPLELDRMIRRCLAKDPDERYQTAREVVDDLRGVSREVELGTALTGAEPAPTAPLTLSRRSMAVAGALLVAAVGIIALSQWRGRISGGILSPAMITSIVALPTTLNNVPADHEYLTDAVPTTLTTQLARLDGVETKLPPTSVEYDELGRDAAAIVTSYRVSAYVTSTINPAATGFQLDVQLIAADDRRVLWGESYPVARDDSLASVRRAAAGILAEIQPETTLTEVTPVTTSPEAERALRRGEHYLNRYGGNGKSEDFELAKAAFEEALLHDEKLARAKGLLGKLYVVRVDFAGPEEMGETMAAIKRWGDETVELDPLNGVGWALLYNFETRSPAHDPVKAFELATRAAALAPDSLLAQNALAIALRGALLRIAAGDELARRFPLQAAPRANAAIELLELDRCEEALARTDEILAPQPAVTWGLFLKAHALLCLERIEEAQSTIDALAEVASPDSISEVFLVGLRWSLAAATADPGEQEAWDRLRASFPSDPTGDARYMLRPAAFRWGRHEEFAELCVWCVPELSYDTLLLSPLYESVRQAPDFAERKPKYRAKYERHLELLDAARERGELPRYLEEPLSSVRERLELTTPAPSGPSASRATG